MSGFNKGKKYSWLPESNPSALSGDAAGIQRSDSGEKTARASRGGRKGGRGRGKEMGGEDGLGISTREAGDGDTASVASNASAVAANASRNDSNASAAATNASHNDSNASAATANASRNNSNASAATTNASSARRARRARKDSVDDLVRTRFISINTAGDAGADGGRRGEQAPMAAITANVRDALASERSAARNGRHAGNGAYDKHVAAFDSRARLGALESAYSFPAVAPVSQRNVTSTMRRGDHGIGDAPAFDVANGENVVVIHAGSRWLRIGRASDAVPREVPHVAARRLKKGLHAGPVGPADPDAEPADPDVGAADPDVEAAHPDVETTAMDVDGSDDGSSDGSGDEPPTYSGDDPVDATLAMLRAALKQHQRHSKRKVPANAYAQVATYNRQARGETIHDHNDPFRIEWIPAAEIGGDSVVGEAALRIADDAQFAVRWPLRNGSFNVEDYACVEDVLGDIEAIWTQALASELGIARSSLARLGAVLVIPDIFSRAEVAALADMLLRRMGFAQLLVQQASALVTFGAGFSSACVVDVGAQKTSVSCVEDGHCAPESRVLSMYGADDITRFLFHMFQRSHFPYADARLTRAHDWLLLTELRERLCTVSLSDVNIRLHDFFVRAPATHTRKFSFKIYDEPYQAPLCLFYPAIMDACHRLPDYRSSFANAALPELHGEARPIALTPTRFGILPARPTDCEPPEPATASEPATVPPTVPTTAPPTPDMRAQSALPAVNDKLTASDNPAVDDKLAASDNPVASNKPAAPVFLPDEQAQHTRMPLDAAITHSIAHAGSVDRAKKLYASIVIVGGGVAFIPGFDHLLASRLMLMRPDYLQGVERVDIVAPPRDLDPRVLAWKGGAVLSRLECAREMWVSSRDWADFGVRMLRDRVLFQW
ncbi:actin-like protein arp8 [Coemansia sp. RSA 2611]|nr:actin-like protein arp8 [Coemansia sp. RSA 2610]KAJ2388800.1 actin-like protein arp8 [Coemansia sp. RSA 2611]